VSDIGFSLCLNSAYAILVDVANAKDEILERHHGLLTLQSFAHGVLEGCKIPDDPPSDQPVICGLGF
jgi:hypothetical protein